MKPENKRKKSKTRSIILIAFLAIYIPSLVHWVYGKTINTELLRVGTIEDSVNADGCIIRDTELLYAPFEGKYIPEVAEGERVPANFRVATILKESSIGLLEKKNQIDLKIIKHQNEKSEASFLFSEDVAKIERELEKKVREIVSISNTNELSEAKSVKEDVNELIKKKATILGGMSTKSAYINSLKKEKERIEKQIEINTRDIYTQTPGVVSYMIDGFEEILNPKAIKELTPEFLNQIETREIKKEKDDNDVQIEKPFAKVIKGNVCHIVVVVKSVDADKFKAGSEIKIRINDINKEIYGKIVYISKIIDEKCIIALEIDRCISETTAFRKINVDLIRDSHEGLKVPLKSLIDVNLKEMKAKIVIVEANYARFRDVRIQGMNNEYAVISSEDGSVSLYDTYVLNPGNIKEGQMITK